jgi:6-phosphofructokinase 2
MIATVTLNPSLDEWVELATLRVGGLNRAAGFERYPGGKGVNVSRVIRELGGPTVAFALSGGEDGIILRKLLQRLRVAHQFVPVRGCTRNNYKIVATASGRLTEINTAGPRVSAGSLRALRRRILRLGPRLSGVALSGSLPPGAPVSIYARWIRVFQARGIPTVLDGSGSALRQGLAARPWLMKPNRLEAEELLGRRLSSRRALVGAIRLLVGKGAQQVILSLGKEGALFGARALPGVWFARAPAVRVQSAVGAGDSVVGGFLVGWMRRRSPVEAFRLGVACGAATAMTPGTELCHRADVRRLVGQVEIRRLA